MAKRVYENTSPINLPFEIDDRFKRIVVATGADNKFNGISNAFYSPQRTIVQINPESSGAFIEPKKLEGPDGQEDVEKVAFMKATVLRGILGAFATENLEQYDINFDEENHVPTPQMIELYGKYIEEMLLMSMDVSTKVALTIDDLNSPNGGIEFHKLIRGVQTDWSDEQILEHIQQDRVKYQEIFLKPFSYRFRVGVSICSANGDIKNTAGLEIDVECNGFDQEVIDEAYSDPNVLVVGPRLNLAALTAKYPKSIKQATVRQININDSNSDIQKGKGTRKKKVLPKYKYGLVERAVVGGVLPQELYDALFNSKPQDKMLRVRSNIDHI